jgi:hypothetical protein
LEKRIIHHRWWHNRAGKRDLSSCEGHLGRLPAAFGGVEAVGSDPGSKRGVNEKRRLIEVIRRFGHWVVAAFADTCREFSIWRKGSPWLKLVCDNDADGEGPGHTVS